MNKQKDGPKQQKDSTKQQEGSETEQKNVAKKMEDNKQEGGTNEQERAAFERWRTTFDFNDQIKSFQDLAKTLDHQSPLFTEKQRSDVRKAVNLKIAFEQKGIKHPEALAIELIDSGIDSVGLLKKELENRIFLKFEHQFHYGLGQQLVVTKEKLKEVAGLC